MKLSFVAVPCMALLLAASPNLRADTVNVSIWEVPAFSTVPAPGSPVYFTSPTYVGTVSNAGGVFNMNSANGPNDYQISNFLTSGGNTVSAGLAGITTQLNTPNGCSQAGCTTDSLFLFSGTLSVGASGLNASIIHDDGFILVLNGSTFASFPNATSPENNSFTIPAGNYTAQLYYAEVDGAPAQLSDNIGINLLSAPPVPEPSSIALFGTGLLAAAGVIRRRLVS